VFVLVIGGGKVGYYLAKELLGSGHEVVVMEKDRARASQIADEIGSIVVAHDPTMAAKASTSPRPAAIGPTSSRR